MLDFLIFWFGMYCLIITAMFIDNLFWMSSSPEWNKVKKYSQKDYLIYCFRDRIWAVIKDKRDIIPAILTSLVLTITLKVNSSLGVILLAWVVFGVIKYMQIQSPRKW